MRGDGKAPRTRTALARVALGALSISLAWGAPGAGLADDQPPPSCEVRPASESGTISFDAADEIEQVTSSPEWVARARALRKSVESLTTEIDAARAWSNQARSLAHEIFAANPEDAMSARVLLHLARTFEIAGRSRASVDAPIGETTITVPWIEYAAELSERTGDLGRAAHARLRLGELAEFSGDHERAFVEARRSIELASRANHARTLYRAQWLLARLHQASGDPVRARRTYRDTVGTLQFFRGERLDRAKSSGGIYTKEIEPVYLAYIDLLLRHARGVVDDESGRQRVLREARRIVELSRAAELRDYFEDECLREQAEVLSDELPGAVVVHPVVLADRVELIVSRAGRLSLHRVEIEESRLAGMVDDFRYALEDRMTRMYVPTGEALYDVLIRPIALRLAEGPVEALVFVPGRRFRSVPMAALRNRETGRFLIEEIPLAITPSIRLTEPRALQTRDAKVLLGGLTEAVEGFSALPAVEREVQAASANFDGEALVDRDFLVARYVERIREAPFDILHIASHAQFSANLEESFILAWDGRLSIERLSDAVGATRFRTERPLELVILSACETATGDDRSSLGLAGAAIRMGARSVVASLWAVNDEASARLIENFYAALAVRGQSRAGALQTAQVTLLRDAEYGHPADWAAFLLISSWL